MRGLFFSAFLGVCILSGNTFVYASPETIEVKHFSKSEKLQRLPKGWRHFQFSKIPKTTSYSLIQDSDRGVVLQAASRQSASSLIYRIEADAKEYPVLTWSWKVERTLKHARLRTKSGDDHPARIYVFFSPHDGKKKGLFSKAMGRDIKNQEVLNYVWANTAEIETMAPSPYGVNFRKIVVQSGDKHINEWRDESRNIYEDFIRVFKHEPGLISAIMLMTDTDNTKDAVSAYYGDISLHKAGNAEVTNE